MNNLPSITLWLKKERQKPKRTDQLRYYNMMERTVLKLLSQVTWAISASDEVQSSCELLLPESNTYFLWNFTSFPTIHNSAYPPRSVEPVKTLQVHLSSYFISTKEITRNIFRFGQTRDRSYFEGGGVLERYSYRVKRRGALKVAPLRPSAFVELRANKHATSRRADWYTSPL